MAYKEDYKADERADEICLAGKEKCYGAQLLSGRVLDSRLRGCRFEPHRCHCVVLEQNTLILA